MTLPLWQGQSFQGPSEANEKHRPGSKIEKPKENPNLTYLTKKKSMGETKMDSFNYLRGYPMNFAALPHKATVSGCQYQGNKWKLQFPGPNSALTDKCILINNTPKVSSVMIDGCCLWRCLPLIELFSFFPAFMLPLSHQSGAVIGLIIAPLTVLIN